jgi:hypothetical protein
MVLLATFDPAAAGGRRGVAGLVERILITLALGTIGAVGWRASRRPVAAPAPEVVPSSSTSPG